MEKIIFIALMILSCCTIKAQLSTGETPYSWSQSKGETMRRSMPVVTLPFLDMEAINKEDLENANSLSPVRFGFPHEVNLSLSNSGVWETTADGGRLWTLKLYSPDALSLNLLYDKFWLPDGAKFFIYSEDMKQHIGAFTSQNNSGKMEDVSGFATGFLYTNNIVLEYYEPVGVIGNGIISITQVISGYRYIYDIVKKEKQQRAISQYELLDCHNDINCPEGDDWLQEKNAVALMVMGEKACTGALLNNTDIDDDTPYFLTANHCFRNTPASQWIFYWNYEAPSCIEGAIYHTDSNKSTRGATVLARHADTDFMFLRLTESPATNTNVIVYYLGWDTRSASYINHAPNASCIHHPLRQQKKISLINGISNCSDVLPWRHDNTLTYTPADTHWSADFSNGTVQEGSSGAPLLNQNKRVIGQLHGGLNGCAPITMYFGRFDISWNSGNLRQWLDRRNTGASFVDGRCSYGFYNRNVTTNQKIVGCDNLEVQEVNVTNGAKLILDAPGNIRIKSFNVGLGSELRVK